MSLFKIVCCFHLIQQCFMKNKLNYLREEEVDKAAAKMDEWRSKLLAKIQAKETAVIAAKVKKERALEQIREQFGFKIDPRDERFQEIMAQKAKEDKKKKKEEIKKLKHERMMASLLKKEEQAKTESGDPATTEMKNKDSETNNNVTDKVSENK